MKGKVCLITGGTAGIGKETAIGLAKQRAQVIIVGRDEQKAKAAVKEITEATGNEAVDYLTTDLSSQKSIRSLAAEFNSKYDSLHVLINNAGAFYTELKYTEDKIETQFALNHLAYFLLTNLLLEKVKLSAPARIINVSSRAHRAGKIHFDDLNLSKNYDGVKAYAQSKLANVLFTYKLAEKLKGTNVTVNCLHPGGIKTGIGLKNSSGLYHWIWKMNPFLMPIAEGAKTSIYLASSNEVEGVSGKYFIKCKPEESTQFSHDMELAEKLWQVSEKLTGLA